MTDGYSDKTIRLLDIVYGLYGNDKLYPDQKLPFSIGDDGAVALNYDLMTELQKEENQDLVPWAHENIVKLFE